MSTYHVAPSLHLTISRPVDPQEVENLIFGTGMLTYSWWLNVGDVREDGALIGFSIHHWDRVDGSDAHTVTTVLLFQQIVDAVALVMAGEAKHAHITDEAMRSMTEDLGLADAEAADTVLQVAVYGEAVYG